MSIKKWYFTNIFHDNTNLLDSVYDKLFIKLNELEDKNFLNDFYMNRYYPEEGNKRIKIGLKEPYSFDKINDVIQEVETKMREVTESDEWEEIEDVKALATNSLNIPKKRLGDIGKLAYFLHHYINITNSKSYEKPFSEGKILKKYDEEKYQAVIDYIREAQDWFGIYMSEWIRSSQQKSRT